MDDYFLKCWMLLKQRKPRLVREMSDIELIVAGLPPLSKRHKHDTDSTKSEPTEIL
jgi:hypothetical protein